MIKVIGEVLSLNTFNSVYHPGGAAVLVLQHGKAIAHGTVDGDDHFEIELPPGIGGEIEIRLGLHGGSSAYATIKGDDVFVTVPYNNDAVKA